MRFFYIAALFLLLLSCSRKQGFEKETPLFINNAEEKLWLFNSITKDKLGKDLHMCALIVYDTLRTGSSVSCFTSIWSQNDSSFYFGRRISQRPVLTNDKKFPLTVSLAESDNSTNWFWQLNRKKMTWRTDLYPTNSQTAEPLIHKTRYKEQYPFSFYKSSDGSSFNSVLPITAKTKISGINNTNGSSTLFINTINKKETLINDKNMPHLVWLNLKLESDISCMFLFDVLQDGTAQLKGCIVFDSLNSPMNDLKINITAIPSSVWNSKLSGKTYPLGFKITINNKRDLIIFARKQEQEVVSKTGSFWMGAISASDPNNNLQKGSGNMYIFKP